MKSQYYLIRIITFPLSFLSFSMLHRLGNFLGLIAYSCMTDYRKRALSNLASAEGSWNQNVKELKKVAKKSFQNLMITLLEYPKLSRIKDLQKHVICVNPTEAQKLIDQGQGILFFCGHQANWEMLFLEGTLRMPGVAIGRPIKNEVLYRWITKIRERFGGKMIPPKQALREGLKALKEGKFLGVVGDQGMPESDFASPFFGKRAYTSTAPALLAYKAKCPIIVATTLRKKGKYYIHYSDPIWPDFDTPLKPQLNFLMESALSHLEQSIAKEPGQWLWQHNRWKQQTAHQIFYRFRKDPILIILPEDEKILSELPIFREIFPRMSLTLLLPEGSPATLSDAELLYYKSPEETLLEDYRFKLIFNLANFPGIKNHYKKLSSYETFTIEDLKKLANKERASSLTEILRFSILRPEARLA